MNEQERTNWIVGTEIRNQIEKRSEDFIVRNIIVNVNNNDKVKNISVVAQIHTKHTHIHTQVK